MAEEELRRAYQNEAQIVKGYLSLITEINDSRPCRIEGLVARDKDGVASRAWRIILTEPETEIGAIFDWDDTVEPYTERKNKFYQECLSLIPNADEPTRRKFLTACENLNRASRILPITATHPEHYAPLLELAGVSYLIDSINQRQLPEFLIKQEPKPSVGQAEKQARAYLKEHVLPKFSDGVGLKHETKDGEPKEYFIEKIPHAISVNFKQKPPLVDDQVWEFYKKYMTQSNIKPEEIAHFDLPESIRFIVATFGEAGFQLEKVVNGLTFLKKNGKRSPDEIILYTRGRKNPILNSIINQFPNATFVYVDDSPRQIEGVREIPRIIPVLARRIGARRAVEHVKNGTLAVDMKTKNLSEIVSFALSTHQ